MCVCRNDDEDDESSVRRRVLMLGEDSAEPPFPFAAISTRLIPLESIPGSVRPTEHPSGTGIVEQCKILRLSFSLIGH